MRLVNLKYKIVVLFFCMYLVLDDGEVVIDFCILLFWEFLLLDVGFCCLVEEDRFEGGLLRFCERREKKVSY